MEEIKESQLSDYIKNEALKKIIITQNKDGNYELKVQTNWKEDILQVITTRGYTREWVNLDRLVANLTKHESKLPSIELILNTKRKKITYE